MALLAWDYKRDEDFKIHTVFSYLGGESSYSALDWFSVSNPTPDYYRYMPGYQANPEVATAVEQAWRQRDPNVTQINWNELYYVNQHGTASPASYVVGSAVTANRSFQLNSSFDWRMDNASYLRGGIQLRNDRVSRYQRLEDLIGGDYLLDVDPYLIDDEYYGDQAINDLQHPNRRVGVGIITTWITVRMARGLWPICIANRIWDCMVMWVDKSLKSLSQGLAVTKRSFSPVACLSDLLKS